MPATSQQLPRFTSPSYLFFALLGTGLLALCAGYAALVLHSSPWAETRQLDAIFPFYKWRTRPYSAQSLAQAWHWLAELAAGMGILFIGMAASVSGRSSIAAWRINVLEAFSCHLVAFRDLTLAQRRVAGGTLVALTLVRGYMSFPAITPEYDDVPSYEMFASKSLLAVSAYYPVPNNHVLSNTLSWLFYHLNPSFWFTMRLPVMLVATAATAGLFVGLLRAGAGFRPAWLATALFSLAQLSLYNGAVGRGYWLLTGLAGAAFFCTLSLRSSPRYAPAAWTGLVVAGVLGAYTVPTFALVLASAFSWLALGFLRSRRRPELVTLAVMGGVVGAGTMLLYTPLLFVSGPSIFFGNGFVTPHPWAEFWQGLPAYLWETEGFLAGQMRIGGVVALVALGGVVLLLRRALQHRMPVAVAGPWLRLAPAALWFMCFPYAVLMAQRVFAPGRTLLYKAFFFFLLLALVVEWLLQASPVRAQRWLRPALSALALLWTTYQFTSLWRDNQAPRRRNEARHAAFLWLDRQPRGPLLVPEPTHSLFVRMYLHAERPGQQWRIDAFPAPGTAYAYVLAFPDRRGYFQPEFPFPPAFHNEQVDIYRLPPPTPGQTPKTTLPSYWHLVE